MDNQDEIRNGDGSNGERRAFWIQGKPRDDAYFTPSIEDIRVGYECEDLHTFKKVIIQADDLESTIIDISTGLPRIRVPYLTKEQIEAEGWRFSKNNYDCWEFNKWELEFSYHTKTHMMDVWKGGQKPPQNLLYGEVKDINTFRYICKLIGV